MNRIWRVLLILSLLTVTVLVGCTSAATTTPPPTTTPPTTTPPPSTTPPSTTPPPTAVTINLIAQNIAFNLSTITVPAGAVVTVNFDNKDASVPHNFAVYQSGSKTTGTATGPIFVGQIITGPSTTVYTFMAPSTPGTYFFRCDVHPTIMTGTFIVQ
jgi:plastocyanin